MSKSGRIRLSDLRRAYRLIHDCRDVGRDPAGWPVILVEGLARLVDAQVVIVGKVKLSNSGGPPRASTMADRGWLSPDDRRSWFDNVRVGGFARFPTFRRFSCLAGNLITRSREQLIPDGEWYECEEFNDFNRSHGLDDMLVSHARVEGRPMFQGFNVFRGVKQTRFGMRERRLIRVFHRELVLYVGTALASEPDGPSLPLPPRLRQVRDCLLEGDSEKQVAKRLSLSRHTIHAYVKDLYRRLGVGSRPELMALYVSPPSRADVGVSIRGSGEVGEFGDPTQ